MPFTPMFLFFFFNDTATTEIYTLSLHDALPICHDEHDPPLGGADPAVPQAEHAEHCGLEIHVDRHDEICDDAGERSEEHTSELQSPCNLVCRLLLEKKKIIPLHTKLRIDLRLTL